MKDQECLFNKKKVKDFTTQADIDFCKGCRAESGYYCAKHQCPRVMLKDTP